MHLGAPGVHDPLPSLHERGVCFTGAIDFFLRAVNLENYNPKSTKFYLVFTVCSMYSVTNLSLLGTSVHREAMHGEILTSLLLHSDLI
jgi:hypothetical protein